MKIKVGVFFGGKSVEHEVSVISAQQAIAALDPAKYEAVPVYITKDNRFFTGDNLKDIESFRDIPKALEEASRVVPVRDGNAVKLQKYPPKKLGDSTVGEIDVALPVVHGTNVEDGALQGFLEYLDIPYASCDVASSAAGMDKWTMKCLFKAAGISVLPGVKINKTAFYDDMDATLNLLEQQLKYPIIVKPVNLGSSVGIGKARDRQSLEEAICDALTYAPNVLCEHAIEHLREINCSVLGDSDNARASVCEEPLNATDFLTYADKYQGGGKTGKLGAKGAQAGSKGMQSLSRVIPADLPEETTRQVQSLAVRAFHAIGASCVSRIDFMIDTETNQLYANEINTIPGSLAFYLWEKSGVSFSQLLDEMISIALKRQREKEKLHFSFDTNLLANASLGGNGSKGSKR